MEYLIQMAFVVKELIVQIQVVKEKQVENPIQVVLGVVAVEVGHLIQVVVEEGVEEVVFLFHLVPVDVLECLKLMSQICRASFSFLQSLG